jgi:hypothetical protein
MIFLVHRTSDLLSTHCYILYMVQYVINIEVREFSTVRSLYLPVVLVQYRYELLSIIIYSVRRARPGRDAY